MNGRLLFQIKVALAIAVASVSAGEPSSVPNKLSTHIGGFLGASYGLELKDGALTYTKASRGGSSREQKTITPTAAQWDEFRRTLDELKVWQWRADYPNSGVMDGTHWSLDIDYSDHALHARGSNNYPDANGKPNGSPESTQTFKRYLAAIQKLVGGEKFD